LDPNAEPVPGVDVYSTVYVPGHLIVAGDPAPVLEALESAGAEFGWAVRPEPIRPALDVQRRRPPVTATRTNAAAPASDDLTRVQIYASPRDDRDDEPVPPIDAWRLLQRARLREQQPRGATPDARTIARPVES